MSFIKIPYALSSDNLSLLLTVKTEKSHIVSYNFTKSIHFDIILDFTKTLDEKQLNDIAKVGQNLGVTKEFAECLYPDEELSVTLIEGKLKVNAPSGEYYLQS